MQVCSVLHNVDLQWLIFKFLPAPIVLALSFFLAFMRALGEPEVPPGINAQLMSV